MKIFGFDISRSKVGSAEKALAPVSYGGDRGWWPLIREPFSGAWQRNQEQSVDTVASHFAVYACVSLIAKDIGKLRFILKKQNSKTRIWQETFVPAINKVLRNPNGYQNFIQFKEHWVISKLLHGNTYILKVRDRTGFVVQLMILDPTRVTPLVADNGDVFYQIKTDNLSNIGEQVTVPASEIVHDRGPAFYHPLVGMSPLSACGLTAIQGLRIQSSSRDFFNNASMPGGILSGPASISDEKAQQIAETFNTLFTGENAGSIAVVGDDMKFQPLQISAVDSQLIEQLKWGAEAICATFNVPSYKVLGQAPAIGNVEAMEMSYYSQCLQSLMESIETLMDDALEFKVNSSDPYGIELDLTQLLRMDTATRFKSHSDAIAGGWMAPNEARVSEDLEPIEGGDTPYMQQQNYALSALAKRDEGSPLSEAATSPEKIKDDEIVEDKTDVQVLAPEAPVANIGLNGAQVSSLIQILSEVALGNMPKETAIALIGESFPGFSQERISAMINPIEIKPPVEEVDVSDEQKSADMISLVFKEFSEGLKNA